MAEAFRPGRTDLDATKKSEVVRLTRRPREPITKVARATSATAV